MHVATDAGHACQLNSHTMFVPQRVTSAGRGQRQEHIFCKRKGHLKKEAHMGDPDYSQDPEDLVCPDTIHNCSESKEKQVAG